MKIKDLIFETKDIKKKNRKIYIKEIYFRKDEIVDIKCDKCGKLYSLRLVSLEKNNFEKICPICKRQLNSLKKYGVKHYSQNKEALKNRNKKLKDRYGVINVSQLEKTKQTRESNSLKNYGIRNPFQTLESREKAKQTMLDKYGVEYTFQFDEVKKNNSKKAKSKKQIEKMKKTKNDAFIKELFEGDRLNNLVIPLFKESDFSTINNTYKWKCKKCGNVFESHLIGGRVPRCLKCFPYSTSIMEREIIDFLREYTEIETGNRTLISPQELDIYIPSHNLAIEFDGLYWHSDIYKDKNYHLNKTLECEKQGIQLIHIFENEWIQKQEIVKARLKNILGLNENRIGARKTVIKEINAKEKNAFLSEYHIQGEDKSAIKLGAYYNDELVGVMTFSKPRIALGSKNEDSKWELSRFATISNTYTPGLASKMLKYFIKNYSPREIYSYADRRWSQGKLYNKLDFSDEEFTGINYWYWDGKNLSHRYKYRKDRLKILFPDIYNNNKTEKEIMNEAGYLRIYDCGSLKYTWREE